MFTCRLSVVDLSHAHHKTHTKGLFLSLFFNHLTFFAHVLLLPFERIESKIREGSMVAFLE